MWNADDIIFVVRLDRGREGKYLERGDSALLKLGPTHTDMLVDKAFHH